MAPSPTIAGTPSTSLLDAPLSSAVSRDSRPSSLRSSSSKFSSELSQNLDPNVHRWTLHENSDVSADESDVLVWKGKRKEGSSSPNNGTREVHRCFPWNSFLC